MKLTNPEDLKELEDNGLQITIVGALGLVVNILGLVLLQGGLNQIPVSCMPCTPLSCDYARTLCGGNGTGNRQCVCVYVVRCQGVL